MLLFCRSVFCLLMALSISGCVLYTDSDPIGPVAAVVSMSGQACGCSGAQAYGLHSLDPDESVETFYYKHEKPAGSTEYAARLLGPISIAQDATKFVGCSLEPEPPAPLSCTTDVYFSLPASTRFARTPRQMYQAAARGSTQRLACMAECDSKNASYCLQIVKGSQFAIEFGPKVANLHARIMDPATTVLKPGELLSLFNLKEDSCLRGDTTIGADNTFSNTGSVNSFCSIQARFPIPKRVGKVRTLSDEVVSLLVPTKSGGSVSRQPAQQVAILNHENENEAPRLKFPLASLDGEYGGIVRSVIATPKRLIFETLNGCTDIPLE